MRHLLISVIICGLLVSPSWAGTISLRGEVNQEMADYVHTELIKIICNPKEEGKPITVYITTDGGSVVAGMDIVVDLLGAKQLGRRVDTYIWGHAFSMGAIIAQVGHTRYITRNSTILFHPIWVQPTKPLTTEETMELFITLDFMQKLCRDLIIQRTNKSPKEVDKLLDKNNFLTAEQALKQGLVDRII